jgi:hypothetical protein
MSLSDRLRALRGAMTPQPGQTAVERVQAQIAALEAAEPAAVEALQAAQEQLGLSTLENGGEPASGAVRACVQPRTSSTASWVR